MGSCASAYLGLRVSLEDIKATTRGPSCGHREDYFSRFCRECGAPYLEDTYKDIVTEIEEGDHEGELGVGGFWICEGPSHALVILESTWSDMTFSEDYVKMQIDAQGRIRLGDSERIHSFRNAMEEAGIWDPDEFGMFAGL
jgi:hypothetical protein